MDHAPCPSDADPLRLKVRMLAHPFHLYDGHDYLKPLGEERDFGNFPSRFGFDLEDDFMTGSDPAEILSFTQAWLFFGTLQEAFGREYNQSHFLRADNYEQQIVTTSALPRYIETVRSSWSRWTSDEFKIYVRKIRMGWDSRLETAHRAVEKLDRDLSIPNDEWPLLLLSIRVLLESLQTLGVGGDSHRPSSLFKDNRPSTRPLKAHLRRRAGWCPHQEEAVFSDNSYLTAIYIAQLRRRTLPWVNHTKCLDSNRCLAYNIDNRTFESKHVPGCQFCEHVSAPKHDMLRILQDGGIPVLRCTFHKDGSPSLSFVKATPGAHYAAVSHLWSDGLGNPHDNTLPQCQIKRIAQSVASANSELAMEPQNQGIRAGISFAFRPFFNLAEKLCRFLEPRSIEFWLDVYCVPLAPSVDTHAETMVAVDDGFSFTAGDLRQLKALALQRMFATYSWARYVLVFDSELWSMSSHCDDREFCARISTCGWSTRCWTYQEYCLAPRAFFMCDRPRRREHMGSMGMKLMYESIDVADPVLYDLWSRSRAELIFTGARRDQLYGWREDDAEVWMGKETTTDPSEIFAIVWNL